MSNVQILQQGVVYYFNFCKHNFNKQSSFLELHIITFIFKYRMKYFSVI